MLLLASHELCCQQGLLKSHLIFWTDHSAHVMQMQERMRALAVRSFSCCAAMGWEAELASCTLILHKAGLADGDTCTPAIALMPDQLREHFPILIAAPRRTASLQQACLFPYCCMYALES